MNITRQPKLSEDFFEDVETGRSKRDTVVGVLNELPIANNERSYFTHNLKMQSGRNMEKSTIQIKHDIDRREPASLCQKINRSSQKHTLKPSLTPSFAPSLRMKANQLQTGIPEKNEECHYGEQLREFMSEVSSKMSVITSRVADLEGKQKVLLEKYQQAEERGREWEEYISQLSGRKRELQEQVEKREANQAELESLLKEALFKREREGRTEKKGNVKTLLQKLQLKIEKP